MKSFTLGGRRVKVRHYLVEAENNAIESPREVVITRPILYKEVEHSLMPEIRCNVCRQRMKLVQYVKRFSYRAFRCEKCNRESLGSEYQSKKGRLYI